MLFQGLAVVILACTVSAQYSLYNGICPPENSQVAAFRNLTDVREPIHIPLISKLLSDARYAVEDVRRKLETVDLPWKVSLPINDTTSRFLYNPFLERCCEENNHRCTFDLIILHYLKFKGGICWVVWPEFYYYYIRCTCCACLLTTDCPVVGRCVETNYQLVGIIAYCPHIPYADRFQKIAVTLPTECRCQAACPTPLDYVLPEGSPAELERKKKLSQSFDRI